MGAVKGVLKLVLLIVVLFTLGWFMNDVVDFMTNINKEKPFSIYSNEVKSPGDWIEEEQIRMRDQAVILMVKNATWATFTDTNSMDPVIDSTSHAIKVIPKDASELNIGDIVSYESSKGIIIHRIVDIGEDEEGIYFVTKGDNNNNIDSEKVRFSQITGVVVGIIY